MKVIIASGGSGGHLFPAITTAKIFRKSEWDVKFMGSFRMGTQRLALLDEGFKTIHLNAQGFQSRNPIQFLGATFKMFQAWLQSRKHLKKLKPDVVLGFGSYSSFPVVAAAISLKIPTLIHEQNVIPGRANQVLGRWVKKIAISFQDSQSHWPKGKTVLTGCPCSLKKTSKSREELCDIFNFDVSRETILIFGGSQGSQRINSEAADAVQKLAEHRAIQVIHICGNKDRKHLKNHYKQIGIPFALFEFFDKMELAYQCADIVISRSGAMTVTELAMFKKPAILIPYPFANSHQFANAEILVRSGRAIIIEEKDLTSNHLENILLKKDWIGESSDAQADSIYHSNAAQQVVQTAMDIV